MEKMNNKSTEAILNEMPLMELVEYINAAYNRRQGMDPKYDLKSENELTLAMGILDKRTGYGIL